MRKCISRFQKYHIFLGTSYVLGIVNTGYCGNSIYELEKSEYNCGVRVPSELHIIFQGSICANDVGYKGCFFKNGKSYFNTCDGTNLCDICRPVCKPKVIDDQSSMIFSYYISFWFLFYNDRNETQLYFSTPCQHYPKALNKT